MQRLMGGCPPIQRNVVRKVDITALRENENLRMAKKQNNMAICRNGSQKSQLPGTGQTRGGVGLSEHKATTGMLFSQ
jgi:hypothetical protein